MVCKKTPWFVDVSTPEWLANVGVLIVRNTYSSGIKIRTLPSSVVPHLVYSFQMTLKNRGPVEYMTVMYGTLQLRL